VGFADLVAALRTHAAGFGLRSTAQIEQYRAKKVPVGVDYVYPTDPDPRRQDAAKITIFDGKDSLNTQVWLPLNHDVRTPMLATWDIWYGKEFDFDYAGIPGYKARNFCSPGSTIWTEVRSAFKLANNDPSVVSYTDIRQYRQAESWGPNTVEGVDMNGHNYGTQPQPRLQLVPHTQWRARGGPDLHQLLTR
jgi:hypothetical protein